jgi:Na+/proline symporter
MSISTGNPSLNNTKPNLQPYYLSIYNPVTNYNTNNYRNTNAGVPAEMPQIMMESKAEKKGNSKWTVNPYIYSLSLAVYCTAWTYYGSIGLAAHSGLSYITIYLGPIIIIPSWIVILKKIIRISRVNKISSIADFISLRYGNSRFIGALVTVVALFAILPYIALQLKAIAETFHVVTKTQLSRYIFNDTTTYVAIALALFASYYGTRYVDASEKRKGIVTAVAMESILKLVFFVIIGIYVTYFVFDGFEDIYQKASVLEHFKEKNTIGGLPEVINWFFLCVLSMFAIFLLPRQFQVAVIETLSKKRYSGKLPIF